MIINTGSGLQTLLGSLRIRQFYMSSDPPTEAEWCQSPNDSVRCGRSDDAMMSLMIMMRSPVTGVRLSDIITMMTITDIISGDIIPRSGLCSIFVLTGVRAGL